MGKAGFQLLQSGDDHAADAAIGTIRASFRRRRCRRVLRFSARLWSKRNALRFAKATCRRRILEFYLRVNAVVSTTSHATFNGVQMNHKQEKLLHEYSCSSFLTPALRVVLL